MRRLRYSVPYIAGKNLPKDSDPAPCGAGPRQPDSLPPRNDFNPLAPCGAGPLGSGAAQTEQNFNPPAPCGAGRATSTTTSSATDFNPPALCGAGQRSCTKKTVQNIAYCTKSAFTLAVLSGFPALMRPFFLPNVHKFRCEPSEESLLAPRSHAYTIRTPSG